MRTFVAGATGAGGLAFVRRAKEGGHSLHALSRSAENAHKLEGLVDRIDVRDVRVGIPSLEGIEVVVSCLGAPITMDSGEKRSYREVDFLGNQKILEAALSAGVGRFVYVSAHVEPAYRDTAYIRAHEEFVDLLRRSGISHSVIGPTGIFTAFNDFVKFARKGAIPVIGDGSARTNPVDPADVADQILLHLEGGPSEISIGGPEIFTRREIAELAFRVVGKRARVLSVPAGVFRAGAKMAGLMNARVGELLAFAAAVSTADCVAPCAGERRLEDHFRGVSRKTPPSGDPRP